MTIQSLLIAAALLVPAASTNAQVMESEPNDTKAQANIATAAGPGQNIVGISTSASGTGIDIYRVSSLNTTLTRHDLTLQASPAGHTARILGRNAGNTADASFQTSVNLPNGNRFNRFYSIGPAPVYYQVTGTASTSQPYTVMHVTTTVSPVDGIVGGAPGAYTISTIGQTGVDTEVYLYDTFDGALIGFDDDTSPGAQSSVTANLQPGVYFYAISTFDTAVQQEAVDGFGLRLDFARTIARADGSTLTQDFDHRITSPGGATTSIPAQFSGGSFGIYWGRIEVVEQLGACCFPDGSCTRLPSDGQCSAAGGTFSGIGSTCQSANCPQPNGRCCLPDGACTEVTAISCQDSGGTFAGAFTRCQDGFAANSSPNTSIVDFQTTTDVLLVNGVQGHILDVDIHVNLTHTFIGDLVIEVTHNDLTVPLWVNACGGNDNLNARFDDEGSPVICASPTVGLIIPSGALNEFDGENPNGLWSIRVTDTAFADQGTLVSWSVEGIADGSPCPQPMGACCFVDQSCSDATPGECAGAGGTYQGDGTACAAIQCPEPIGACCSLQGFCYQATESVCLSASDAYQGDLVSCEAVMCPQPPTGACCREFQCINETSQSNCLANGGMWLGDGSVCAPSDCEIEGACCLPDGTCAPRTLTQCTAQEGYFIGFGVSCGISACPDFPGACCTCAGECIQVTEDQCVSAGGIYHGTGVSCNGIACATQGACCLPDGTCTIVPSATQCAGEYRGDCSRCEFIICPVLTGRCCTSFGTCIIRTQAECEADGGIYGGNDTTCDGEFRGQSRPLAPIRDFQTTSDTIPFIATPDIVDVNISIILTHSYVEDLTIDIVHNGITVRLWNRGCGSNDNMSVTFDDEGGAVVCGSPMVGRITPNQPLSAFDSTFGGDWMLIIRDLAGADQGTLVSWSILGSACETAVATGACCIGQGNQCGITQQANCEGQPGRIYLGDGTSCGDRPCSGLGACCIDASLCIGAMTGAECLSLGGAFSGVGSICTPTTCEATGACCLGRCECDVMTEAVCADFGGTFLGTDTQCGDAIGCAPTCPCDWNGFDGLDSQDFFDFLSDFFDANADFNCDGERDSQDYFEFNDCFFGGVCGP